MSRRREIGGRLAALTDIAGILSAMKSLALMETRLLSDFLDHQQRLVAGIEAAAADFLAWRGEFASLPGEERELCVLVGSEQGFCGDFNEAIVARVRTTRVENQAPVRWAVVGQRLAARLADDPRVALALPGATVVDEVPAVLLRLTRELNRLLATAALAGYGLSALYHCEATGDIRRRWLLPLRDLPPAPARAYPPELNLSPADFLAGLTDHYLYAVLNEVLYSSLMAENQQRLMHMDRALDRLDADTTQLRLAYNRQRQEEIIEEIEVILLSADLLAGEESRPSTPA
jgi:F-type H+-transporting ATPase subunit gamma